MRLLIMGPPGAGKGTHSAAIAEKYQIPWISTGEMFRHHIDNQTDLGKLAQRYIDRGEFVPDEVTHQMVDERISQMDTAGGFLLDGFPRSIGQAEHLQISLDRHGHQLDAAIYLDVNPEEVTARMLKRAEIEHRPDDTEPLIRRRLEVFFETTRPLLDYYRERALLREIPGEGEVDEVRQRVLASLAELS